MSKSRRPCTVAILGPFGWGNLGDAAIQDAVLAQIRARRSEVRIVGISMVPEDTRQRHGIQSYAYDTNAYQYWMKRGKERANPPDALPDKRGLAAVISRVRDGLVWRLAPARRFGYELGHVAYVLTTLRNVDVLLISGGGQLDEFWGGPWQHPYTLFKWALLTRVLRKKLVFLSVGAGDVGSAASRRFLGWALRLAQYRSYRDEGSKEIVRAKLGVDLGDPVVPDMAFALPVSGLSPDPRPREGRLTVAVGPMPYCHPSLWPVRDAAVYGRYVATMADFCRRLIQGGAKLTFIVGEAEQDPIVIRDIVSLLEADGIPEGSLVIPHIPGVRELVATLLDVDLVVASRFHGALLSLLLRKPVIALSYERKVRQLMRDLDQETYCLDITDADADDLANVFKRLERDRHSIIDPLSRAVERETAAVFSQFDAVMSSFVPSVAADSRMAL